MKNCYKLENMQNEAIKKYVPQWTKRNKDTIDKKDTIYHNMSQKYVPQWTKRNKDTMDNKDTIYHNMSQNGHKWIQIKVVLKYP